MKERRQLNRLLLRILSILLLIHAGLWDLYFEALNEATHLYKHAQVGLYSGCIAGRTRRSVAPVLEIEKRGTQNRRLRQFPTRLPTFSSITPSTVYWYCDSSYGL